MTIKNRLVKLEYHQKNQISRSEQLNEMEGLTPSERYRIMISASVQTTKLKSKCTLTPQQAYDSMIE